MEHTYCRVDYENGRCKIPRLSNYSEMQNYALMHSEGLTVSSLILVSSSSSTSHE